MGIFDAANESDGRFRTFIDTIPALAWVARPDGAAEFFNRRWLDYTGSSAEQAVDRGCIGAIHPDDRDSLEGHWRSILISGEPGEIEARMRRFDGEYRWFLLRASALRDESGSVLKWYGAATDIEDLRRAEQAARTRERTFRLIVDGIPGLVFTTTAAGEIEMVNRHLLQYFDKSIEELKHWTTSDAVHPDDIATTIVVWRRGVESGRPVELDQRLRRADGVYRWFHFRAVPSLDSDGHIIRWCGALTDIEDLKRAEETLRGMQARLSRAAHIATVSELSASIAHEINQPLAAVVANGDACLRWLSAQPPNVERALLCTERIIRDGNSAAEVIQRIRTLFRRAPPVKYVLNMNEVIEEVCSLMSDDLRNRCIALKTDLQIDLPEAMADRVQMQQVLINLARNGIEAMDGVTGRLKELSISSRYDGGAITVHIADHGVGISDAEKVFESFYTTKSNGMGMGLAICRSIVEAHGGQMWASQNAPYGTVFALTLPISATGPR